MPPLERNSRGHRLPLHRVSKDRIVHPDMAWQELIVRVDENPPIAESNLKLKFYRCSHCKWNRPAGTNTGDLRKDFGEHIGLKHE